MFHVVLLFMTLNTYVSAEDGSGSKVSQWFSRDT